MRRIVAFLILGLGVGCTGILGTFDVASQSAGTGDSGSESGIEGGGIVEGGSSEASTFEGGVDASPAICTLMGSPLPIDSSPAIIQNFVRVYHLSTGVARIIDLTAQNVSAFDVQGGVKTALPIPADFVRPYSLKQVGSGLSLLAMIGGTPATEQLSVYHLDDSSTTFAPLTAVTAVGQTTYASASFAPTAATTFLAAGTDSPAVLYVGPGGPNATLTGIHPDANPKNVSVLNVIDVGAKAYIFTSGDLATTLPPLVYVVSDLGVAGGTAISGKALSVNGASGPVALLDVEPVGIHYAVTMLEGVSQNELIVRADTGIDVGSFTAGSLKVPAIYTFTSTADFPVSGDSRWEGATQQLVVSGGSASDPGLNLLWYDGVSKSVRAAFNGTNRLLPTTNILGVSATVSGAITPGGTVTMDIVWVQAGNGSNKDVFYQKANCSL